MNAQQLKAKFSRVWPEGCVWPQLGLHSAVLAKLEMLAGNATAATQAASAAQAILKITHAKGSEVRLFY